MKNRNEIPVELTWDLSHIFKDSESWEKSYKEVEQLIPDLASLKGNLSKSGESLFNSLELYYSIDLKAETLYQYAMLKKAQDGGDTEAQSMCERFMMLYSKMNTVLAFFSPEIASISDEKLKEFLEYAPLKKYEHILEDKTRLRSHVLDEKSESILAKFGRIHGVPSDVYDMYTNVEMELPEVKSENGGTQKLSAGSFRVLRESKNKEVRDSASVGMFGTYGKTINTFSTIYGGSVKQDNIIADIRGYSSARAMALARSNVPEAVYDSLIEAIHNSVPYMSKYLKLRAKALKADKIDVFDLYTPMVDDVEFDMPYANACELVLKAVQPLGDDYVSVVKRGINERWIDVYETPGKESGAFSDGVYGVHPYVKLNYADALDDAFTLAHELGHAMHSYYSSKTQDFANHSYHILVAEVASTCNEVLLTKYLLSVETDKRRRAYIINHFLEGFRTTVFRQTLFAEFEYKAHTLDQSGTPLTSETLCKVYEDLEKLYYPDAEFRDEIKYEWAFIPHFYNAFYVYQYATGFSSAVAIASKILETGDASDYLKFLTMGGSDYPINELKVAGVDLTSPSVVQNAMKVFDESIDELAEILK